MGLIVIVLCSILGSLPYLIFKKIWINLIKFRINNVIRNDCLIYNDDKYTKESYFNRKFFKINLRSDNINRLNQLIQDTKNTINNNNSYLDFESNFIFLIKLQFSKREGIANLSK